MEKNQLNILYHKYLLKQASADEIKELFRIIDQLDPTELSQLVDKGFSEPISENEVNGDERVRLSRVLNGLLIHQNAQIKSGRSTIRTFFKYGIAASLFLAVSFSIYFYVNNSGANANSSLVANDQKPTNDLKPGSNKATLILADGRSIDLSNEREEVIIDMRNIKYSDGTIVHDVQNVKHATNTIITPKGGQYQVRLPDGTKVWLNALSKIKFPNAFSEDYREVEVEGEAYFEVAQVIDKNKKKIPFYVKSKEQAIEVLGTHFNVSNYTDEDEVSTTLFEGSIQVSANGSENAQLLVPGQQAILHKGDLTIQSADLDAALAWKNGDFVFNNETLESIMKKISRWYDVEVIYQNASRNQRFSGAVSRSKNLSEVLKIMEMTDEVVFKIEGRRVIIMS